MVNITQQAPTIADKAPYLQALAAYLEERHLKGWQQAKKWADNPRFDRDHFASWKTLIDKHPRQLKYQRVTLHTLLDILWSPYDSLEAMHIRIQQTLDVLPLKHNPHTLSRLKEKIQKVLSDVDIMAFVKKFGELQENNADLMAHNALLSARNHSIEQDIHTLSDKIHSKDADYATLKTHYDDLAMKTQSLHTADNAQEEKIQQLEQKIGEVQDQLSASSALISEQTLCIAQLKKSLDAEKAAYPLRLKAALDKQEAAHEKQFTAYAEETREFMQAMMAHIQNLPAYPETVPPGKGALLRSVPCPQPNPRVAADTHGTTAFSTVFHDTPAKRGGSTPPVPMAKAVGPPTSRTSSMTH